MTDTHTGYDTSRHRWREVLGAPDGPYKVRHDYTILGHDRDAGTLDMLVRWSGDGGHCPAHRRSTRRRTLSDHPITRQPAPQLAHRPGPQTTPPHGCAP